MSLPDLTTVTYEAGCRECNCCTCCLRREKDFAEQRSGIEEAFDQYNTANGTKHRCLFLPKFHPELNYIERIWARMKYYIRKHCDNKFETMLTSVDTAMGLTNLPLAMIRRYARTSFAYMYAYQDNMDIIAAHDWVKKHRQHRGIRKTMDAVLDSTPHSDTVDSNLKLQKLYHPPQANSDHFDHLNDDMGASDSESESDDADVPTFVPAPVTFVNDDALDALDDDYDTDDHDDYDSISDQSDDDYDTDDNKYND